MLGVVVEGLHVWRDRLRHTGCHRLRRLPPADARRDGHVWIEGCTRLARTGHAVEHGATGHRGGDLAALLNELCQGGCGGSIVAAHRGVDEPRAIRRARRVVAVGVLVTTGGEAELTVVEAAVAPGGEELSQFIGWAQR